MKRVQAEAVRASTGHYGFRDNFTALLGFEDGSLATLTYTALGSRDYPKEKLEAYWDGNVLSMEDFRRLALSGAATPALEGKAPEKGQAVYRGALTDAAVKQLAPTEFRPVSIAARLVVPVPAKGSTTSGGSLPCAAVSLPHSLIVK